MALAAAHSEAGDFDAAVKWQSKALEVAAADFKDFIGKGLAEYRDKKPYRQHADEDDNRQPAREN